jgi:hypothetical protein
MEAVGRQRLLLELGPVSGARRRGLLALPLVTALARSPELMDLIRPHLPAKLFPVRANYFNKSADAIGWFLGIKI